MRRLQLRHGKLRGRRKGGKKKRKRAKRREREGQLDKNRRESNKEWGINKGKKKMLECILLLAREMERNWSLEREMVE